MISCKLFTLLVVLVVIYAGWYFLSPLFINQSVDEALPVESQPASSNTTQDIPEEEKVPEDIIMDADVVMDEERLMMPQPEIEVIGNFQGADTIHRAEGKALSISNLESHYLRFEDFSVTNGPELVVLLSTNENPAETGELGEYVELADLKGNKGNQNYALAGVDLRKYNSVVIYCKPFKTIFGSAEINL